MSLFDELKCTRDEYNRNRRMDVIGPSISVMDTHAWINNMKDACVKACAQGETSLTIDTHLYESKFCKAVPDEDDMPSIGYVDTTRKCYVEENLCPKGYYLWYIKNRNLEKNIEDRELRATFHDQTCAVINAYWDTMVLAWYAVHPEVECCTAYLSIVFDWEHKRVTKQRKVGDNL